MLFWSIQITLVSIILIFLVHHLINYFKATLTIPKIKDLVNMPAQKYEHMYNIISQQNSGIGVESNVDYTEIELLPKPNVESMKNELKSFLKQQLNSNTEPTFEYSNGGNSTYSEY
jgi:hypothetical protein